MTFVLDRIHETEIVTGDYCPSEYYQTWWNENARRIEKQFSGFTITGNSITLIETTAASIATPATGSQTLFIDSADHKLKRKDSSGTVTIIA